MQMTVGSALRPALFSFDVRRAADCIRPCRASLGVAKRKSSVGAPKVNVRQRIIVGSFPRRAYVFPAPGRRACICDARSLPRRTFYLLSLKFLSAADLGGSSAPNLLSNRPRGMLLNVCGRCARISSALVRRRLHIRRPQHFAAALMYIFSRISICSSIDGIHHPWRRRRGGVRDVIKPHVRSPVLHCPINDTRLQIILPPYSSYVNRRESAGFQFLAFVCDAPVSPTGPGPSMSAENHD